MSVAVRPTTWQRWQRVARRAAEFQSRVLLFLLYYLLFVPLAFMRRLFGDPIGMHRPPSWIARPTADRDLPSARRQY